MPDLYDTRYPEEVAGHVEAGSFVTDDMPRTTQGMDDFFTGDSRPHPPAHRVENVGTEAINKAIGETVRKGNDAHKREPISNVGDSWRCGNVTLIDNKPIRLVIANKNRKDVVVTNQSNAVMYGGRESGLQAAGPNVFYLPAGAGRTFEHLGEIWIVGVAGQVVDYVETNYV